MPHADASVQPARPLTAVLFGLSGCLVDFGARMRQQATDKPDPEQAQATPLSLIHI